MNAAVSSLLVLGFNFIYTKKIRGRVTFPLLVARDLYESISESMSEAMSELVIESISESISEPMRESIRESIS